MKDRQQCPPLETLSAWHDGEIEDRGVSEHVKACAACSRAVDTWARIDQALTEQYSGNRKTLDHIIAGCMAELERKPPQIRLLPARVLIRIAASLVMVGVLIQLGRVASNVANPTTRPPNGPVYAQPGPVQQETPLLASGPDDRDVSDRTPPPATAITPAPPRTKSNTNDDDGPVEDGLRIAEVQLVSSGPDGGIRTPQRVDIHAPTQHSVADHVHHVWLVDDATAPLEILKPLLPDDEAVISHWIEQRKERYRLQLTISDSDLQGLVNRFDALGYTLVSPAAPQPGLIRKVAFSAKVVLYEVDFVKR